MIRNFFEELKGYKDSLPNKFTIHLGKLIREARIEANLTQSELAKTSYFSQTAISQIEQGKRDVSAAEIIYLGFALDKPILYFYQPYAISDNNNIELSPLDIELLNQAKKLSRGDLIKLIAQTKALVDLDQLNS